MTETDLLYLGAKSQAGVCVGLAGLLAAPVCRPGTSGEVAVGEGRDVFIRPQ